MNDFNAERIRVEEANVNLQRITEKMRSFIGIASHDSRSPPVQVEATRVGDMVEIRVYDHGPGVPPEFVPKLFGKFARANTSSTKSNKGTGLGLSIVRGLAEVNGGQTSYEPNTPNGGCFVVCLPACDRQN